MKINYDMYNLYIIIISFITFYSNCLKLTNNYINNSSSPFNNYDKFNVDLYEYYLSAYYVKLKNYNDKLVLIDSDTNRDEYLSLKNILNIQKKDIIEKIKDGLDKIKIYDKDNSDTRYDSTIDLLCAVLNISEDNTSLNNTKSDLIDILPKKCTMKHHY